MVAVLRERAFEVSAKKTFFDHIVNWPPNIKEIALEDMEHLLELKLPDGIEKIRVAGCQSLRTMNFPTSLKDISFYNNIRFQFPNDQIIVHEGVEKVGFGSCELSKITLPQSVRKVSLCLKELRYDAHFMLTLTKRFFKICFL